MNDRINLPPVTPGSRVYTRREPLAVRVAQVMTALLTLETKGVTGATVQHIAAEIDPRLNPGIWNEAVRVLADKHLVVRTTPPAQQKFRKWTPCADRVRFRAVLAALTGTGTHADATEIQARGEQRVAPEDADDGVAVVVAAPSRDVPPPSSFWRRWFRRHPPAPTLADVRADVARLEAKMDRLLALWTE